MTLVSQTEVEWQFDADSLLDVEEWLHQRAEQGELQLNFLPLVKHCDHYLDTPDWRFYRAGYVLRVRQNEHDETIMVTLKSFGTRKGGLRVREELSEMLAATNNHALPQRLIASNGQVGQRIQAVVGRERLQALCEVHTERQRITLRADGEQIAEIALDAITIPSGQRRLPYRIQRVEVELSAGLSPQQYSQAERFVEALRRACKLTPAKTSKFHLGISVNRLAPPAHRLDLGSPASVDELDAQARCGELAIAALRQHFTDFLDNEPGARLGEDPEAVHHMRTATRRLRVALKLFGNFLPEQTQSLRDDLRWIGRALGAVRDCDVQMQRLQSWQEQPNALTQEALRVVQAMLAQEREKARAHLLRLLNSTRYQRMVERFVHLLSNSDALLPRARRLAQQEMPALLLAQYARLRKKGDALGSDASPEEYHALRMQCRRLRYALEFCAPLYPRAIKRFLTKLIALQDVLGEHQDAWVALQELHKLRAAHAESLDESGVRALQALQGQYEAYMRECQRAFPRYYRRIKGKSWQRVQNQLDRE
ncbi:MAG: CHAD domain-containing protein [Thermoflexales bacterium]